jgi:acyl-CoA thioesterase-1
MNCLRIFSLKILLSVFLIFSYSITAETKKLLILGDSISAGYGIKESQNWVALIENNLEQKGINLKIVNSSISGDTTIGGVTRIDGVLKKHKPDYVLIELGGNDALRGYPISNIKDNLEKIVTRIKKQDSKPFLMQIKIPPNYGKKYIQAFEKVYLEVSNKEEIPLFSFMLEKVALNDNLMQPDGIHPNAKAQPLIAREIETVLMKEIKFP